MDEEKFQRLIESNDERWRQQLKREKKDLTERAMCIGVIAVLSAFVIGFLIGGKVGL